MMEKFLLSHSEDQAAGGEAILNTIKFAVLPITKVFMVCFMGFVMASKYVSIVPANGRKLLNGVDYYATQTLLSLFVTNSRHSEVIAFVCRRIAFGCYIHDESSTITCKCCYGSLAASCWQVVVCVTNPLALLVGARVHYRFVAFAYRQCVACIAISLDMLVE
ncbi:hypothetical protein IEQ34_012741 [Dendrobium chrysotoxum]|uniref:Uncharacterized protein n=1 Tax=Dendrobium chrysotoxum TaxID=161865 RepID=A0AAV7GLJ6_DENCH|nr:hypothetical protein IEQ34_012741 [Dendrobium chrysotoxum]